MPTRTMAGQVAMAIVVVELVSVTCLVVFFAAGGPFGTINDVANGVVGVLSVVLAWLTRDPPVVRVAQLALGAAVVGGVLMVLGTVLVIFEVTGYYFAGLVYAAGAGLIGAWLLVAVRVGSFAGHLTRGQLRFGLVTGSVMLVGVVALLGILAGVDDLDTAPWYVNATLVNWLGTYVLFPIWCFWFARRIPD